MPMAVLLSQLTRVFSSLIPLNEADDEQDQDEQSDGTHEADEPSLGGDVDLSARHSWPEDRRKTQHVSFKEIHFPQWRGKAETILRRYVLGQTCLMLEISVLEWTMNNYC